MKSLKEMFLKEGKPFTAKRDIDSRKIKLYSGLAVFVMMVGIFFFPESRKDQTTFYERAENGTIKIERSTENNPTQDTIKQLQDSQVNARSVHNSLDHLYKKDVHVSSGGHAQSGMENQSSSMIINRDGSDSKNQLQAGTRIHVKLTGNLRISQQAVPVIGVIARDVDAGGSVAIPSGSKILGEAVMDESSDRASIAWRSIILTNGRERPLSAIGAGKDGELGIHGRVFSDGVRNAVGQTLTRFVGAYAAGSINTGTFGANAGGNVNGLRNAIAQTATDRANSMGENLQKQRKWIELDRGIEMAAILNQAFAFREAGGVYAR